MNTNDNISPETKTHTVAWDDGTISETPHQQIRKWTLSETDIKNNILKLNSRTDPSWLHEINSRDWETTKLLIPTLKLKRLETHLHPLASREPSNINNLPYTIAIDINTTNDQNFDTKTLAQILKNPPPLHKNFETHAKEQLEWAKMYQNNKTPNQWREWCSYIRLNPERLKKLLPKIGTNKLDVSLREEFTIAFIIDQGRRATAGYSLWEESKAPLCCPCITSTHPHPRSTCMHPSNTLRLNGTHDKALWQQIKTEHESSQENPITETFNRYDCLCERHYNNQKARDHHALIAQDGITHGAFFDELPQYGGSFILIDRLNLTVIKTGNLQLCIPNTKKADSTWAEFTTILIAQTICQLEKLPNGSNLLPNNTRILTKTGSSAAKGIIKNMVESTPTLSEETKTPSGEGAATMRALRQSSPKQEHTHEIRQHKNEHDHPLYDDELDHFPETMNKIVDYGATYARDRREQESDEPFNDFGSSIDKRGNRPIQGNGYAHLLTHNGLKVGQTIKILTREIHAAIQLDHLSQGNATGILPRMILGTS